MNAGIGCGRLNDDLPSFVLRALPPGETGAVEAHLARCADCRREVERLRALVDHLAAWPIDVTSPNPSLQARLASRIAVDAAPEPRPADTRRWVEPAWEPVAPGIECKLLSTDAVRRRVSMLVRLAPGASYPAHVHAGTEELHLLDGELWIDARKLVPGDYNFGPQGDGDQHVFSETGCTCVLITSMDDALG